MTLTFVIENDVILSYRRLSYTPWHALAEFVDNSTQAYFNSRADLDPVLKKEGETLEVRMTYDRDRGDIVIADNSVGMSYSELERALQIGKPPSNTTGRSQYGMGMKTAACWLGQRWEIVTKRLGETVEHRAVIDVDRIASGATDLEYGTTAKPAEAHYTVITISDLHKKIQGRTNKKIKDFLTSMYRVDLREGVLRMWYQDEEMIWQEETSFLRKTDGTPYRAPFSFAVNGKDVTGWVGILGEGRSGRPNAGFSILRRGRVVRGHPQAWRPEAIFGYEGRNDLINQRIVGEIHLDEFGVSHTKDDIQWEEDEEEQVEKKLKEHCADYIAIARSFRKGASDTRGPSAAEVKTATDELRSEMQTKEFADFIDIADAPPPEVLAAANAQIVDKAKGHEPDVLLNLGRRYVCKIYISNDYSVNDPYYVHEITHGDVVVVVNQQHPHWNELDGSEGVLNFLRHCVYDAIAEWRASIISSKILPETVKMFKDYLLRLPSEIESADSRSESQD